jgi:hypothetical protein
LVTDESTCQIYNSWRNEIKNIKQDSEDKKKQHNSIRSNETFPKKKINFSEKQNFIFNGSSSPFRAQVSYSVL